MQDSSALNNASEFNAQQRAARGLSIIPRDEAFLLRVIPIRVDRYDSINVERPDFCDEYKYHRILQPMSHMQE